jgi:hypothetical protein
LRFTVRAFVTNTSPYVKVAQLETRGQNVHLWPLKPIHETAQFDVKTMTLTFVGEDETRAREGGLPEERQAEQLRGSDAGRGVIGSYKDGVFYAEEMLVKCPSKYQGETQTARN